MKLSPVSPRRPRTKKDKGRVSLRAVVGIAVMGLLALLVNVYSVPPDWWASRGVLDAQQVQDQNAAVNVGQLKSMAAKAMDEMDAKFPGGAGPAIHALVQDWRDNKLQHDQSAALNVGQLKAVAKPYYDRLVEVGARPANAGYPWPNNPPTADNNALVNAGQVKNVFSFAIPLINDTDSDGDGMPDGWELTNGLNPAVDDSLEDNDGDRVPNLFEFKRGTLANDPNSKPIATLIVDPAMGGVSSTDNIYSTIKEALVQAALPANAYAVIEVKSGVYAEQVLLNGTTPVLLLGELGNVQGPPTLIGSLAASSYAMVISNASVVDGFIIAHVPGRTGGGVAATATAGSLTPRRRLINCVIRGNDSNNGGGIFNSGTKLDLVHCTVTGNKGTFSGRAIYNNTASTLNLVNSIVWGNTGSAIQEIYNAAGSIVTVTGGSIPAIPTSIIAGGEHGGINVDPQLTPVGWLKSSSPAINRIGVAVASASRVDIHGEPRPAVGTTPDLGADEFKDSNGNGLPDWLEGADDNDGLAALDEYLIYGTSPLLSDTDGDGVSDGAELAQGTNPLDDYYHAQPPILKFVGGGNQWGVAGTVLATPISLSVNNGAIIAPVTFTASNGGLISADGVSNWQSSLPMLSSAVSKVAQVFVKLPDGIGSSSVITASVYTGGKAVTVGTWVAAFDPTLLPPTNVVAIPTASNTVSLNWTPSDLTKATTIELSIDGGATWLAVGVASAGVTTATITGVPSDTATIVRVQTGGTPTDGGGGNGGGGLMFSILAKIAAMTPLPDNYSPELISSSFTAVSKPTLLMERAYFIGTRWGNLGLKDINNNYLTRHESTSASIATTTYHIEPKTGIETYDVVDSSGYTWSGSRNALSVQTQGSGYDEGFSDIFGSKTTYYGYITGYVTLSTQLSDLYPMAQFLTNVESWVPSFQNNFITSPDQFNPNALSSPTAIIKLTPAITNGGFTTLDRYYIKKLQYKWQVNSDPNLVVNWWEVFTPDDGSAPTVEAKTWASEGKTESPDPPYVIDPTLKNEKKNGVYSVVKVEFEVIHTETDPDTGQVVNPGTNTMLRDEIVDIRIKVPPIGTTDRTVDLAIEPEAMRNENLPNRGNVQMYDFGQVETNGTVTPDKTQFVLQASAGGERTIKAVFNKEGKLKVKMKSTDGKLDFTSPDYTIQKRIRKYANLPSNQSHDLNQHDKAFIDAAAYWGGVYQHAVDDVERLKAMGMAESELGITDAADILTVGNNDDFVIPRLKGLTSGIRLNGTTATWTKEFEFLPSGAGGYSPSYYNYQDASKASAPLAIKWGVCWFFKKATMSAVDSNNPPTYAKFDGWRTWDSATTRYNGGGVSNYLERVNRSMKEGRHPSSTTLYIWPIKTNKKARGNQ